jgi:pilus assembly protein CpaB
MKWSIVILLILGLVAAASAALLMTALSVDSSASEAKPPEMIEVAMAKEAMPAAMVITNGLINKEMVSKDELPEGQLTMTSSLQVLGRVLRVPVVEGQILTESCFVKEGIGAELASQIPHGMRAVTVIITSKIMPDGILLYPGCVVDVLVSYKLSKRSDGGEAISQTMLTGIHVLAISGDSVVSRPVEEGATKKSSSGRGRLVTLLVNTYQAEALHLAVENGSLTMTLRNPLDKEPVHEEGSVLDVDSIGRKGETIEPTISSEKALPEQWFEGDNPRQEVPENGVPATEKPAAQPKSNNKSQNRKNSSLDVEVIRGPERKVLNVDVPDNKNDEITPKK